MSRLRTKEEIFQLHVIRNHAQETFDSKWIALVHLLKILKRSPSIQKTKKNAYVWLAKKLKISGSRMQFRYLTYAECEQVIVEMEKANMEDHEEWAQK